MTTTTPLKVHPRTWYSENMDGNRCTNASAPTNSGDPLTVSLATMNDKILQPFKRAIFTVDLTAQGAPLQADPDDVQKVFDHLRENCRVTHLTLFADDKSTKDFPRLPPSGFKAVGESYEPFTHLLNIVVHAANFCLTHARYLKDLHFHHHGVEMREMASGKPLKPDILGLLHPCTLDEPDISWNNVAVFIAVKDHLIEAVKQLATYAHSHLAVDRRRSFSIAIAFNHKALTLHFLCFHRSGISISPELHLDREDGFQSVIENMLGILSIRDEDAFGLDMTRVENLYRLNDRDYKIVRTIQERHSICGHSTVVYSLKLQTTGARDKPASLRSRKLTRVDGVSELPEKLVYKLSYQPKGRPSEGALFSDFRGQFGIVDIVGFHICSAEEVFGSTAHYFSNSRFLNLDNDSTNGTPEIRHLHCTAMMLEGLPLLDISDNEAGIPTPAELIETILHSMIGHFNLFLGGVLHRDISCGNILRLQEPIKRSPGHSLKFLQPILDEDIDLSLCQGFLIDGDHAIEWNECALASLLEQLGTGTLPFMSSRVICAWSREAQVLHTAADDLESFLWVLVWSLVCIFKCTAKITNKNSSIHLLGYILSSHHILEILAKDSVLKSYWREKVFRDLICGWLDISMKSQVVVTELEKTLRQSSDMGAKGILNDLNKHCEGVYKSFIQTGYKHLRTIRAFTDWKEVIDFNGESLNK